MLNFIEVNNTKKILDMLENPVTVLISDIQVE